MSSQPHYPPLSSGKGSKYWQLLVAAGKRQHNRQVLLLLSEMCSNVLRSDRPNFNQDFSVVAQSLTIDGGFYGWKWADADRLQWNAVMGKKRKS